ncbi:hypothetical protein NE865_10890 [Phthorimaea operculella]|nr:hypothetical protein NE865_10890 [Phthorimaea operculella]
MKWVIVLLLCLNLAYSFAECPAGEYDPGPNCVGFEYTCAPRSSHFMPKHTCDCWCNPGTYRNLDTNQCVKECTYNNW